MKVCVIKILFFCVVLYCVRAKKNARKNRMLKPLIANEIYDIFDLPPTMMRFPESYHMQNKLQQDVKTLWKRHVGNVLPQQEDCKNDEFRKNHQKLKKDVTCKLMDTVVNIIPENGGNGNVLVPSAVLVKRCMGICGSNQKTPCHALQTEDKTFYVRVIEDNGMSCRSVVVSQDLSCTCDCSQKESDCQNNTQIYNRNSCSCECKNDVKMENEYKKCHEKRENIWFWDSKNCHCACKEKPCTTGTKWSEQYCRCKKAQQLQTKNGKTKRMKKMKKYKKNSSLT